MAPGIQFSPPLVPFRTAFHYGTYLWLCHDRNGCMLAVYSEEEHLLPVDYWNPNRRLYSISCYNYINSLQPIANDILVRGLARFGWGVIKPAKAALEEIIAASRGISVAFANHSTGVPELDFIPHRKLMISDLDSIGRDLTSSAVADISIDEIEMNLVPSAVAEYPILDDTFLRSGPEDDSRFGPSANIDDRVIETLYREKLKGEGFIGLKFDDPRRAIWSNIDYGQIVDQYGEIIKRWTKGPWICAVDPEAKRNLPAEFSM